ncbi:MAG: ubiquinone biosynthesis protein COQ9, partial [Paracoccaceae bacterium]
DDSPNFSATWEFLDRRIENVMQIEKLKAQVNSNPLLKPLMAAPNWLLGHIKAPTKTDSMDLPGTMRPRR